MAKQWESVKEGNVRIIWQCEEEECDCGNEDVELFPCDIFITGVPTCPETGVELDYLRTEVSI